MARANKSRDEVRYEPRLYYDDFVFGVGDEKVFADADIFRNTEQWPVRITHMLAAMRVTQGASASPAQGDERLIQRYGLRIRTYDRLYPSGRFSPISVLHNTRASASMVTSHGLSVWRFEKPFALGQRDKFIVEAELSRSPSSDRRLSVGFGGLGRESKRPYWFATHRDTSSIINRIGFSTDDLMSQSTEVVDVLQMQLYVGSPINSATDLIGDLQHAHFRVRRTGIGTDQWFCKGPAGGLNALAPAALWGVSVGRAVVHKLPDDGWLLAPGQGFEPEMQSFDTTRTVEEAVWLGFAGHAVIS